MAAWELAPALLAGAQPLPAIRGVDVSQRVRDIKIARGSHMIRINPEQEVGPILWT